MSAIEEKYFLDTAIELLNKAQTMLVDGGEHFDSDCAVSYSRQIETLIKEYEESQINANRN